MNRTCTALRCTKPTSGYSKFCGAHRHRVTRHGHPDQTAVTAYEVRPYLKELEKVRKKDPTSPAWAILEKRWAAIVARAVDVLETHGRGVPGFAFEVEAARMVQNVAGAVGPQVAIDTCLAVVMMWNRKPGRFLSDAAFQHQLVKRVAALGPRAAGSSWDHQRQRVRKVYRDIPPRAAATLGHQLIEAFARAGIQLAELPQRAAAERHDDDQRLDEAMKAIKASNGRCA